MKPVLEVRVAELAMAVLDIDGDHGPGITRRAGFQSKRQRVEDGRGSYRASEPCIHLSIRSRKEDSCPLAATPEPRKEGL